MPVHWAEKKKPKPDKVMNLQRLRGWYGNQRYYTITMPYVGKYRFPLNLSDIRYVMPDGGKLKVPFSPHARLKCQNCGLFNRGALCPPRLGNSYPHLAPMQAAENWLSRAKKIFILIWKNDGTKPWTVNWDDVAHIEFKKVGGRRLKGVEHASAKAITRFMKQLEDDINVIIPRNLKAYGFIPGHCDLCGRYCPLRERRNSRCKKGGMPSMEALGIDVYELLDSLSVDWCYPVMDDDFLTQVTMLVVQKKVIARVRKT